VIYLLSPIIKENEKAYSAWQYHPYLEVLWKIVCNEYDEYEDT
jgi:hypothetical protein